MHIFSLTLHGGPEPTNNSMVIWTHRMNPWSKNSFGCGTNLPRELNRTYWITNLVFRQAEDKSYRLQVHGISNIFRKPAVQHTVLRDRHAHAPWVSLYCTLLRHFLRRLFVLAPYWDVIVFFLELVDSGELSIRYLLAIRAPYWHTFQYIL